MGQGLCDPQAASQKNIIVYITVRSWKEEISEKFGINIGLKLGHPLLHCSIHMLI